MCGLFRHTTGYVFSTVCDIRNTAKPVVEILQHIKYFVILKMAVFCVLCDTCTYIQYLMLINIFISKKTFILLIYGHKG